MTTKTMRRSSRQVRRETLLSLLASLGDTRCISWVHMGHVTGDINPIIAGGDVLKA